MVAAAGGAVVVCNRRLTLYSVLLHFLDLGDGFSQVVCEFLSVLGVGSVEVDQHFDVRARNGRRQPDPVGVIWWWEREGRRRGWG